MKALLGKKHRRAIVIGGSMSGLLAARTLADHFHHVLVLERDAIDESAVHRRGVPQGRHTHVVLVSGCRVLESLFPGISGELTEAGALTTDVGQHVSWFAEGGRLRRFPSDLHGIGASRPLLERIVRARVLDIPNIGLRDGAAVDGLFLSKSRRRVAGVRLGKEIVDADVVVDASGRGSRSPRWLEELGYTPPREEKVEIELRYTTRVFRRRPHDLNGDHAVIIPPTPQGKRGGALVSQEGDRWTVTLLTHFGDFPPADLAGFIAFARSLPAPDIYAVIRDAEPIGEAQTMRIPASLRHRYEHLKRLPAGYLAFGDAISSFNPIYGQGMSIAALEAAELQALLRKSRRNLSRRFFRRAAKIVDVAWSISVGNDLRMPEAGGRRSAAVSFTNWYVARMLAAGQHDPLPAQAFLNVSNLVAPPRTLLHPRVMFSVARAAASQKNGSPKAATPA